MTALFNLINRFRSDERGVFAVIFGLSAVVLIALSGAVVDFVSMEQTRNRAQVALDAATLALQKQIFVAPLDENGIRAKAQALMLDRINDANVTATVDGITVNIADGSLTLTAEMSMPTLFVRLVGVDTMRARILSEATRKKVKLEVAMVLDNSGSMGSSSRLTYLKQAANCATNIIFYDNNVDNTSSCSPVTGATKSTQVKIGVVPFTSTVNVGTANSSASWIDSAGISPIANDNFDNDDNENTPFTGNVDRLALYSSITNESWKGCVETRPHIATGGATGFLDTDDTPATTSLPASMFVPYFAPDISESTSGLGGANNYTQDSPPSCDRPSAGGASCTKIEVYDRCNSSHSNNNCRVDSSSYIFTGPQNTTAGGKYVGSYPPSCDCRSWGPSVWAYVSGSGSRRTFTKTQVCLNGYIPTGLSAREYQERICKYDGAISYSSGSMGPNSYCSTAPILPLTDSPRLGTFIDQRHGGLWGNQYPRRHGMGVPRAVAG
ncbi:pilus assembly protein [Devosia algicola]|uniref:Pilus assembly protein n=1 Tax=Devosia algicola TaxID=3026418 RepID=A0ABY7YMN7_9HYPH|nr:TadE/TadG family type IV pilus assembly protein [Devosia algicola]WDR02442.1 pilus assembly protein [Devosia algicola]